MIEIKGTTFLKLTALSMMMIKDYKNLKYTSNGHQINKHL